MAGVMNNSRKIVFSRTLKKVDEGPHWKNIELRADVDDEELTKAKEVDDTSFTILGSGTIVQQLTRRGLVDEYRFVVNPVVLGDGKRVFADVGETQLRLRESQSFDKGLVWLCYEPKA
jgi:dihydrofolate reductase